MRSQILPMVFWLVSSLALMACSIEGQAEEVAAALEEQRDGVEEKSSSSLEQWIRSGFEFSWESGQPMRKEVRQVWSQLGRGGTGYGFRTSQARGDKAETTSEEAAQSLISNMEVWKVTLDELHTDVVGEIGLVWGAYTEEFKLNGESTETLRVRFTNTMRWNGQGWENLLYHRDAQLFSEDGAYIPRERECDQ